MPFKCPSALENSPCARPQFGSQDEVQLSGQCVKPVVRLHVSSENSVEPESVPGQPEEAPPTEDSAAGLPAGRRNPPGGKSSLILG